MNAVGSHLYFFVCVLSIVHLFSILVIILWFSSPPFFFFTNEQPDSQKS